MFERFCAVLVFVGINAFAQPGAAFEVASVKTAAAGEQHPSYISGNRFSRGPTSLFFLIMYAYDVKQYQVLHGPDIRGELYVIDARAPGEGQLSEEQAKLMVRNLLAERFSLKLHHETKETSVYELSVTPRVKLKQSTQEQANLKFGFNQISTKRTSMAQLATLLSIVTDRPVIDRTGLSGDYEVEVSFSPIAPVAPDSPEAQEAAKNNWPSIFTAMENQLGLKLVPAKDGIDVLVIDSWQKPTSN